MMKENVTQNQTDAMFGTLSADQNKFQRGLYEKFPAFKSNVKINKGHKY